LQQIFDVMICENYSTVVASGQCVVGIDHDSLVVALLTKRFNIKKLCYVYFLLGISPASVK
jgi:hypothetical protein